MNIYVYQIGDKQYGAGTIEAVCEARGKIVECWPVDNKEQIDYVKRNGSAFHGIRDRVCKLAQRAEGSIPAGQDEFEEEREAMLLELSGLPFKRRFKAGLRVIFGSYQEEVDVA